MKVGIIGYARSGKTTIFNALTGAHAEVGAFGSRDANVAVVKVPDERVERLAEIYKPKKTVHAEFAFMDIAPNEAAGADKALNEAALTVLKNVEALVHVVRAFHDDNVMHPLGTVDPLRDCRALDEELQFSDLIIIEKRLERLEKENRKDKEYALLRRCREHIEAGKPLRTMELSAMERTELTGFTFLSLKPLMLLGNYGDDAIGHKDPSGIEPYAREHGLPKIDLCGAMEMEVAELPEEDRAQFRQELGLGEESRTAFLHHAYDLLGLMSFLTAGDPEVHAWTIPKGTKALEAAGVIHSDIQRGFIRAEVVHYDDFMAAGSMAKAKEAGHVRLEGKDYLVRDGDIMLFRFNV
ncbi:MAG TPA: redox-regulated ATPase YchF [Candidatus Hydrogenedentes bacterium]|nr:redox-regulated ATPase YchF [Candidatus Hydrogenedentota bacterium]